MLVDVPNLPPALRQRAHARLLWRIMQRYAVITDPVQIGPIAFEFTRVADPNAVLEAAAQEEDRKKRAGERLDDNELHLPYWAEIWDSSIGLTHFLVHQWVHCGRGESAIAQRARASIRPACATAPLRVMDLGCGMGLTGAAAGRLGMHVLFADMEAPALLFAALNSLPDRPRSRTRPRSGTRPRSRTRRVNWQTDRLAERFDFILGADILYDCNQWPFLDSFFQAHLAPDGAILIAEPGRATGEEFEPWIQARGWKLTRFTQPIPARDTPISLLQLTREGSRC